MNGQAEAWALRIYCIAVCLAMAFGAGKLLVTASTSVPIMGQDYLALQHKKFPPKAASKYLKAPVATGNLDFTFGTKLSHVRILLTRVAPTFHRVHILNTTCLRRQDCASYEILAGLTPGQFNKVINTRAAWFVNKFRVRVLLYKMLSKEYPGTTFLLSPALEHDLGAKEWRILADLVKADWPEVQLVNSPNANKYAQRYKGAWVERHGTHTKLGDDIVSLDGVDAEDIDIDQYRYQHRNAKIIYLWTGLYNCRTPGAPSTDPRARTVCAGYKEFKHLAMLAK